MESSKFFATVPNGIADLLAAELLQLGALAVSETRAGVQFEGTIEVAYRACLWSRLANRILMPLAAFRADSPEALYDGIKKINWANHLSPAETIAVDTNVSSSNITHSHYAALKIKDAIADQFAETVGDRPSVDLAKPDIQVNCYLMRDQAQVYLDLSGTSLHQRNYRLTAGQAPLKENLAAALLLRARWPEIASRGDAFADLMCGSGTLVIEAALMAADIAPALTRQHFGFNGWKQHNHQMWDRLLSEASYRREKGLANLPEMIGFDNDARVLGAARDNADRADLSDKVTFIQQDIFSFQHQFADSGLMLTNPPYGRRLAQHEELPALYRAIGDVLKHKLKGWSAAVFTEDSSLGKNIGIRADKLHSLFNGAVPCKLIHFAIEAKNFYRDERLPQRIDMTELSEQALMFKNRLAKNIKQLDKWAKKEAVTCFRAYDADLPDYSAAIDVYHSATSTGERWVCLQEYEAPASIAPEKSAQRTRELVSIVQSTFDVDDSHLFYKTRARQRGESQYEKLDTELQFHTVREGAGLLRVNFKDYLDTGLFLDHRPIRSRLFNEAKDKSFLNLFAYTGAATVQAALGGARSTTTIDMSRTYIDWARKNFAANGLDTSEHELIQADCLQWLTSNDGRQRYDLIFVDPPSFSNSKRMNQIFDIQTDHTKLIRQTVKLLAPGGKLYFSTNLRNFKLSPELQQHYQTTDISANTIPFDFKRRQNIHRCWEITQK